MKRKVRDNTGGSKRGTASITTNRIGRTTNNIGRNAFADIFASKTLAALLGLFAMGPNAKCFAENAGMQSGKE